MTNPTRQTGEGPCYFDSFMAAERKIETITRQRDEAVRLLREVIDGWDKASPEIDNAFLVQHARTGVGYEGPHDFAEALTAIRAFLATVEDKP